MSSTPRAAEAAAKSEAKATDVAKADDDTTPANDNELEIDEDLSALVDPAGPLANAKRIDQMKYSQELHGLLTEGMTADSTSLAAARRRFEAAQRAVPDEPRAAYAYGVAFLAHNKLKEALEQFQSAARHCDAPYLPALQGIAWVHVLKNDFGKGVPALLDLANKIEKRKGIWPTDHDRQHSAEWLGRVMGYLAGPGHQADRGAQIEELAADLDSRLTGGRKEAYEHGRKSVAGRYKELQALAARPVEEVLAEAKQKRQELADAAREAEGEVKRFEEALVELKKPIHKQLEEIKRDMREAAAKANKAKRELPDAIELVDELSQPQVIPQVRTTTRNRVRTQMLTARAETAQEKKARETKLASAKQTLAQIQSSVDNAKQSLTDAKAKRDETQKLLKKTTAEKLPELTAARRKAQELSVRMRDADRMALTPEKLKSRVTALETYAPLDSESEKNRLLATLKTSS